MPPLKRSRNRPFHWADTYYNSHNILTQNRNIKSLPAHCNSKLSQHKHSRSSFCSNSKLKSFLSDRVFPILGPLLRIGFSFPLLHLFSTILITIIFVVVEFKQILTFSSPTIFFLEKVFVFLSVHIQDTQIPLWKKFRKLTNIVYLFNSFSRSRSVFVGKFWSPNLQFLFLDRSFCKRTGTLLEETSSRCPFSNSDPLLQFFSIH